MYKTTFTENATLIFSKNHNNYNNLFQRKKSFDNFDHIYILNLCPQEMKSSGADPAPPPYFRRFSFSKDLENIDLKCQRIVSKDTYSSILFFGKSPQPPLELRASGPRIVLGCLRQPMTLRWGLRPLSPLEVGTHHMSFALLSKNTASEAFIPKFCMFFF